MPEVQISTRRLVVRGMTVDDYEAWKAFWVDMFPKQNKWDNVAPDKDTY